MGKVDGDRAHSSLRARDWNRSSYEKHRGADAKMLKHWGHLHHRRLYWPGTFDVQNNFEIYIADLSQFGKCFGSLQLTPQASVSSKKSFVNKQCSGMSCARSKTTGLRSEYLCDETISS